MRARNHLRRQLRSARPLAALLAMLGMALALSQGGCRAEQPWPLWQHYTARFLDPSGRIVDHTAGDRTTSEGQAYGMFFALVANDRSDFDKMLHWTEDNLAGGDLTARLPAWSWGKTSAGEWKQLDPNSASDADLWLAYDCLEAGRLWRDARLQKLGSVLADHVARSEVALTGGAGTVLLAGQQGFHPDQTTYVVNPSYAPPQLLARFRQESPNGPWLSLQTDLPALFAQSSPSGFAMDWVLAGNAVAPAPAPQTPGAASSGTRAVGSYDAIRVYLWFGMADKSTLGVKDGLATLGGMRAYLKINPSPPLQVDAAGNVLQKESGIGFSAAVVPYLEALGEKPAAKTQVDRLEASLDPATGLYGRNPAYYDQNLILFSTGWFEHRFRFDREGRLKTQWR